MCVAISKAKLQILYLNFCFKCLRKPSQDLSLETRRQRNRDRYKKGGKGRRGEVCIISRGDKLRDSAASWL